MLLLFMSILHNFEVYGTSGEERKSRKAAANSLRGGWWQRRTLMQCVFFLHFSIKREDVGGLERRWQIWATCIYLLFRAITTQSPVTDEP